MLKSLARWTGILGSLLVAAFSADAPANDGIEFFEKKIRPALIQHCYECHAADSKAIKGGLVLDTREGTRRGGDTGPAVVPGKPDESLLLEALRYNPDSYQMPPSGKLPRSIVDDFEKWVAMGAPDPRDGTTPAPAAAAIDVEAGREFWAFQPTRKQAPPAVKDGAWPRTEIDHFILAALEAKDLRPTLDADRTVLVRRLYFDLIGLPPTPEEIDAFLADESPHAVAKLVDTLLASPHFGERWGRHWLDIARYADSTGGGRSLPFPHAWRYRDYVIDAFNHDKPYDQFLREQIAGDLYLGEHPEREAELLIATGLLELGPTNYELQDKTRLRMEVVDEQIDTVGRIVLGMTLGCARCHDHKFDPIPTADYYALAGIFGSTKTLTPGNVSGYVLRKLPTDDATTALVAAHDAATETMTESLRAARQEADALQAQLKGSGASGPERLLGIVVDDNDAELVGEWSKSTYHPKFVGDGYLHDGSANKGNKYARFIPDLPTSGEYEVRMAYAPGTNRATNVPVTVKHAKGEKTIKINQQPTAPIDGLFISLGRYPFEAGRSGSVTLSNEGTTHHVIVDAVQFIPVELLTATSSASGDVNERANPDRVELEQRLRNQLAALQEETKSLEKKLADHKKKAPVLPMAMAVQDEEKPKDEHIRIRGNVHSLGAEVPRGLLSVASSNPRPEIRAGESGRRELAEWLSSGENPLTARVMVNRVWHHLFGSGLVRTVDSFGTMGELPSHPELLDYLAVQFVDQGWSVKQLVRAMALSRVYQLSSDATPELAAADPENRLFGRAHRRRLTAEAIRDAMLATSGQLDRAMGGRTAPVLSKEYGYQYAGTRRSVYMPMFRNALDRLLEVFDVADPNLVVGRRTVSTVPTQALFLMNSEFVMDQARHAAQSLLNATDLDDAGRVQLAYRRILGRPPRVPEREAAFEYLAEMASGSQLAESDKQQEDERLQAWAAFVQTLYACIDFRYVH